MRNSITIAELLRELNGAKFDSTAAKVIIRHVLCLSAVELVLADNRILTHEELQQIQRLIAQCQAGYPVAYVTQQREFYAHTFTVTPDTLIPRPETELLVTKALALAKLHATKAETTSLAAEAWINILDLGTGCGCIAISIALANTDVLVTAVDNSQSALRVAVQNAQTLNARVTFKHSDWYQNIQDKFHIIISNPPYISAGDPHLANLKYEPQQALTDGFDGIQHLRTIIFNAQDFLLPHGYLLVEHGYNQGTEVRNLFITAGFTAIITECDYAHLERYTYAKRSPNGRK